MTHRKGPQFERDLMAYMRTLDLDVERLRLAGTEDEGDLLLRTSDAHNYDGRFVLEAKAERRYDLSGYVREAQEEAVNYAIHRQIGPVHYAAVVKRHRQAIAKAYVVTTLDEWLRQVAL